MNPRVLLMTLAFVGWAWAVPAWADDGFRPRFEAGTVFTMGTAYELVLRDGTYSNPVSKLTWPIQPSMGLGLTVTLPWVNWTSTTLGLQGTFPLGLGTLTDEDWNAGDLIYGKSTHDSDLTAHYEARLEQGFQVWGFDLRLGGLYKWTTWEGWNGSGTYQRTTSTETDTFSGPLITYRQEWFIPYLGLGWTYHDHGWSITPSGRFSPFTFCFDSDLHDYGQGGSTYPTTFLDTTSGGYYSQFGLEAEFDGGPGWSWGVRGTCEVAYGATGGTTAVKTNQSSSGVTVIYPTTLDSAGTWYYEASLAVFVRN